MNQPRILTPPKGRTVYYIEGMHEGDIAIARTPMSKEGGQVGVYQYQPYHDQLEWVEVGLFWDNVHAVAFASYILRQKLAVEI